MIFSLRSPVFDLTHAHSALTPPQELCALGEESALFVFLSLQHLGPASLLPAKQITFVSVVQDSIGGFSDAWDDFEDARTIWSFFSLLLAGLHLRNYFSNQTPTSFELLWSG